MRFTTIFSRLLHLENPSRPSKDLKITQRALAKPELSYLVLDSMTSSFLGYRKSGNNELEAVATNRSI